MKAGYIFSLFITAAFLFHPGPGVSHGAEMGEKAVWNTIGYIKPSDKELRKSLSPLQYKVTRENRDEPPFQNEYWNNDKEGIYVDIVSGEPLFSSLDKFRSGTGRPSFTKPLEPDDIVERRIRRLFFMKRTEVRSRLGDSHLGYLFEDALSPTGLRYSVNSASLRFIAKEDLQKEGYSMYSMIFTCESREWTYKVIGSATAPKLCSDQKD